MSAGRRRRLDANRGIASGVTRATRRAHQRARARRDAWLLVALIGVGPLVWLIWPVKSLLYYFPKWYAQMLFVDLPVEIFDLARSVL